jgi:hypothetical protein
MASITGDDPKVWWENINPSRARELLDNHVRNRILDEELIDSYTDMMVRDKWYTTGETIKLAEDARLINGQHTLHAIIKSGTTQRILMVQGITEVAIRAMDRPKRRTTGQTLVMQEEGYPHMLAAALSHLWRDEHRDALGRPSAKVPPTVDAMDLLDNHPGLRDSVNVGDRLANLMSKRSLMVYLHYKFSQIDPEDASDFFFKLQTGSDLTDGDAILTLRRMLEKEGRRQKSKYDDIDWHAFFTKAWNAYRQGRPLPVIQWKRGGSHPHDFPDPI